MPHRGFLPELIAELGRRKVFRVAAAYAIVAWGMVEVADTVSPHLGLPDWFPTLVIVALGLGFPIALVLAWAFDISPDGVTRTPPHGVVRRPGRATAAAVLAGVVLVATAVALRSEPGAPGEEAVDAVGTTRAMRSIAVLPFMNMSSDRENEHFGDGLAEELLNSLAQIPELRVAARTSSFAFKGVQGDVTEFGRRLNVETVVEGSVRRMGNTLKITAQLIDTSNGYHLWSGTFEREMDDIFRIQDEISTAIVGNLLPRLSSQVLDVATRHPTENVEAYELYLRGRHRFWQGGAEELKEAAGYFERAVALDPEFGLAYAGLADAHMLLAGEVSPAEAMPLAKAAALKALEVDPRLAEGYVALASINWLYDWDWAAAEQHYRLSFSANPLLHTRCVCYAWYLSVIGDLDAAVIEAERAREMDPLARLPRAILSWMYYLADRPADARAELAALLEVNPNDVTGRRITAWLLWDEGRPAAAIDELERVRQDFDRRAGFERTGPAIALAELATMYALSGRESEARQMLAHLRQRARARYVPAEYLAAVESALGDADAAASSLARAYEGRSNLGQFSVLPLSRTLRKDPRYLATLAELGLTSAATSRPLARTPGS